MAKMSAVVDKEEVAVMIDELPRPNDFENYMPWACAQMQVTKLIALSRTVQQSDLKSKAKSKPAAPTLTPDVSERDMMSSNPFLFHTDDACKIIAVYTGDNTLIELKFVKNQSLPRSVFQVLALIIQFYPHLQTITINCGLSKSIVHELASLLIISNISEICLDDAFLTEANYYVLLEGPSSLKRLSLSRCKIDDVVIKSIASKLEYPLRASKTLALLSLSSNKITDVGAQYLSEALQSNRQLRYLNLADNMITDKGAEAIFNSLQEFELTNSVKLEARARYLSYLKKKEDLIEDTLNEFKSLKKTSAKLNPPTAKKSKQIKETKSNYKNADETEASLLYKAELKVISILGEFNDPFLRENTTVKAGNLYCYGNNTLCYLNLAYNGISYLSVKKLLSVLKYQKELGRKPKGLINVSIEGNQLPSSCKELSELETILEIDTVSISRLIPKKRSKTLVSKRQ